MDAQKLKSLIAQADKIEVVKGSAVEGLGLQIMDEVHTANIFKDAEPNGDAAGLVVLSTNDNKDFPVLVGYLVPIIVPDKTGMEDLGYTSTLLDIPAETIEKIKEIADKHGFELVSLEDLNILCREVGLDIDEFYKKYIYY